MGSVGRGMSSAGRGMGRGVSSVGRGMGSVAGTVGRGMGRGMSSAGRGMGSMAGSVGRGMGGVAGTMGRGMGSVGRGMGGMAGKMGRGMGSMAGKMGRGMKFAPVLAAGALGGGVGGMFGKVKNVASMGISAMGKLNPMSHLLGYPTSLGSAAKGGMKFLIKMVGIPVQGVLKLVQKLPTLLILAGGFGGMGLLVGQNYFNWMAKMWKYFYNGWRSAPLVTWCETWKDGTCRCTQELFISKWDDKPVIEIIDKDGKVGEEEGTDKKLIAAEAAKKAAEAASDVTDKYAKEAALAKAKAVKLQIAANKLKQGKGCFMNRQCPSGSVCKKSKWNPRGKCTQPDVGEQGSAGLKPEAVETDKQGKGCFMNKQCPSGSVCKKKNKWSPRGKCTQPDVGEQDSVRTAGQLSGLKPEAEPEAVKTDKQGKGCFMNKQCPSGSVCKKKNKWSPRGKCTTQTGGAYKHFLDIRPVLNMLLRVENKNGKLKWTVKKLGTTRKHRKKKRHKTSKNGGWRYGHEVKAFTNEAVRRAKEAAKHGQLAAKYSHEARKTRGNRSRGNQKTRKR